jgi:hypothetical protein
MTTTIFGIVFLIGAALGLRFRVWVLIPFTGLAIVGTTVVEISRGESIGFMLLTIGLIVTILEIGYFVGLLVVLLGVHRQKPDVAKELSLP